jgi:hypothetical protein
MDSQLQEARIQKALVRSFKTRTEDDLRAEANEGARRRRGSATTGPLFYSVDSPIDL